MTVRTSDCVAPTSSEEPVSQRFGGSAIAAGGGIVGVGSGFFAPFFPAASTGEGSGVGVGVGGAGGARSRTARPSARRKAARSVQPSGKGFRRAGWRGPSRTAAARLRRNGDVVDRRRDLPRLRVEEARPRRTRTRSRRAAPGSASGAAGSSGSASAARPPASSASPRGRASRRGAPAGGGRGARGARGRSGAASGGRQRRPFGGGTNGTGAAPLGRGPEEVVERPGERLGHRLSELLGGDLLLLLGVRDEGDLDEDGRRVDADQDAEGGLLDAARRDAEEAVEVALDDLGEAAGGGEVLVLGEVPEDQVEVAEGRVRLGGGRRRRLGLVLGLGERGGGAVGGVEREVVDLRPVRRRRRATRSGGATGRRRPSPRWRSPSGPAGRRRRRCRASSRRGSREP